MVVAQLTDEDYQRLLALRTSLRRFLRWSHDRAIEVGLTPAQHQLLLAVRGHDHPEGPTIGNVANYLLLRHHSAVELVRRAEAAGLLERHEDPRDRRVVRLKLTGEGRAKLRKLSAQNLEELDRLANDLRPIWFGLEAVQPPQR